jgi:hypothetical protein
VPKAIDGECGVTAIETRVPDPAGWSADCSEEEHPAAASSIATARTLQEIADFQQDRIR